MIAGYRVWESRTTARYKAPADHYPTPLIVKTGDVALADLPDCNECPLETYLACQAAVREYKHFSRPECNMALASEPSAPVMQQLTLPGMEDYK
jgi:hypothetical protein